MQKKKSRQILWKITVIWHPSSLQPRTTNVWFA